MEKALSLLALLALVACDERALAPIDEPIDARTAEPIARPGDDPGDAPADAPVDAPADDPTGGGGITIGKHPNGRTAWRGYAIVDAITKEPIKVGEWVYFFEDGSKEKVGRFVEDQMHGEWTYWHDNGQKSKEGLYKDGKQEGAWTYWHDNGQKSKEGLYKDGKQEGVRTTWDDTGKNLKVGTYNNGEFVAQSRPSAAIPFGAAAWIPADYDYYSSVQGLGGLLRDVRDSRAFANFARLPIVADTLAGVDDAWSQIQRRRADYPLLDDALYVLDDALGVLGEALDGEVFLACGPGTATALHACAGVYLDGVLAALEAQARGRRPDSPEWIVDSVLGRADALRVPTVIVGLGVGDRARAARLCDRLAGALTSLAPDLEALDQVGDVRAFRIPLPDWLVAGAREAWRAEGLNDDRVGEVLAFVEQRRPVVALGVHGQHLLLSIGSDTEHLRRLGADPGLTTLPAFARVRLQDDAPISLTYASPALNGDGTLPADDLAAAVTSAVGDGEAGAAFVSDLRELIGEWNAARPTPRPYISAVWRRDGLEAMTIDVRRDDADSAAPLATLAHAGAAPTYAFAWRSGSQRAQYEHLSDWTRRFYHHFDALVVPQLARGEQRDFAHFDHVLAPAFAEFDAILRRQLLPAVEAGEVLVVGREPVTAEVDAGSRRAKRLTLPLPTIVWKVRDADAVVGAAASLHGLLQRTFDRAAADAGRRGADLGGPRREAIDGGVLYSFELDDLQPCVAVVGDLLVFAATRELAEQALATQRAPRGRRVAVDEGAAGVAAVDVAELSAQLVRPTRELLYMMAQARAIDKTVAFAWLDHLTGALHALSAVRRYESRTWHDGDVTLHHSHWQIEDR